MKTYQSTFTFDGKRYYVRRKTKKEADKQAAIRLAALQAGKKEGSSRTVNSWWPEYLQTYHAKASDRTRKDYHSLYENAIAPQIGPRALKSVRNADLQRLLNDLSIKSSSYVKKAKILIVGMFRAAEDNGLIDRSPARSLRLPETRPAKERRALTPKEREAFLKASASCGSAGQFFRVIYYCGLRPSEVARIRAEDYNKTRRILHVRGTKTKAAVRDVPVPSACVLPDRTGLLFPSPNGSELSENDRIARWQVVYGLMKDLYPKTGEDLTTYCLRHDYCTRLQEAGVPIDVARRLMGHSSIEVTSKIYTHGTEATLEAARALIESHTKKPHK